jgi:hypothetical protein
MMATFLLSLHSPFKHSVQQNILKICPSASRLNAESTNSSSSFATFCMPYNFCVCLRDLSVGLTDSTTAQNVGSSGVYKCDLGIQMTGYTWEFIMYKSMGRREFRCPKGQNCLYLGLTQESML